MEVNRLRSKVSVLICVRNNEKYMKRCIQAILNQSFTNFELIIVDDLSSDETAKIIKSFKDKRIKYFKNNAWLGISKSRNQCLKHATGEFLFFTDGDCAVSPNWIEEGLKSLNTPGCVGVEGALYYVSKNYRTTFADYIMQNQSGGNFMTGNVAYTKNVVDKVGGFDEALNYLEDRDIAFRIMRLGKIKFNPKMVVHHPKVTMTPQKLLDSAAIPKNRVRLFKKYNDKMFMLGPILFPLNIAKILCPPIIFLSLACNRFKDPADYSLLPFFYVYVIRERLQIWKQSVKERVFVI